MTHYSVYLKSFSIRVVFCNHESYIYSACCFLLVLVTGVRTHQVTYMPPLLFIVCMLPPPTGNQHSADVRCGQVSNYYYSLQHIIFPSPMLTNKGAAAPDDFVCFTYTGFESETKSDS